MSHSKLQYPQRVVLLSVTDLPSEILVDIFLRLPIKSLVRIKWTCKLWHNIVTDPDFVEKQWKYSIRRYPGYFYRYKFDPNIYFIESSKDGNAESSCISYGAIGHEISQFAHGFPPTEEDAKTQSAGGLFAFISLGVEKCMCICNPFIGEQVRVPMDSLFGEECTQLTRHSEYRVSCVYWWAFGYSYTSKVYKIFILVRDVWHRRVPGFKPLVDRHDVRGYIYTLGSGSTTWRKLQEDFPFGNCSSTYGIAECDGDLFFLCNINRHETHKIVSFVVKLENFRILKGPETTSLNSNEDKHVATLFAYGDTLAYGKNHNSISFTMWVLRDKVDEVWVKELEISTVMIPWYLYTKEWINGGIIFGRKERFDDVLHDIAQGGQWKSFSFPYSTILGLHRDPLHIYRHSASLVSPRQIMGV